jgi:hypothetical protein
MVSVNTFRKMVTSFKEVEELPHFDKTSFRVRKKIFSTLEVKRKRACLKFTDMQQADFIAYNSDIVYPVPGKWGKMGWTYFELSKVPSSIVKDALRISYLDIAPKSLR